MTALPAFAQEAPATPAAPAETAEAPAGGDIVVTGSLLRNPNLSSVAPVSVVDSNEISLRQAINAETILRDIPGTVPSIGAQVNNGNGGASLVNLRGLGSNRNIVLLDGNRIVPADLTGVVDLNNIPLALVQRVDVLTGGASTTYGADAIAGVVNFITRTDFSGLDATVQKGITQQGDGATLRADLTLGGNFADDKGNAVLSVGYQMVDAVYQGDRSFSNVAIDSFTGKASGSGTAVPGEFSLGSATRQIDPSTGALVPAFAPYNFNPSNLFQTPYQRYNVYAAAHYDISDSIQFYTRGLFSKNTVSTIVAPSGVFGSSVTIPYSNPYLPAAARAQFCAANGLTTAQCDAAAVATSPTDPNYATFDTNVSRRMPEAGPRQSDFTTTLFDYRAGVKGAINSHINWDLSGGYGESENVQATSGYVLTSKVRQAALATSTSTCLDTSNNCVPVNLFGPDGSITAAQAAFLTGASSITVKTTLAQVHGQITGDLGISSPFATSPIGFAVGAEYRRYTAQQRADALAKSGDLGGFGSAPPDIDGAYSVYEGFAETDVPLIEDRPLFKSLDLQAGIRRSQYQIEAAGSPSFGTTTYKAGLNWEPVPSVKFRGNYQHAVRAPNINELFSPVQTVLTNYSADPCAGTAPVGNANLTAICRAQGAPASAIGVIETPSAGQANLTTGGDPNLRPETSDSFTLGVVFQPTFVPHLTATVDYYNIKVANAITTATPQDLVGACFNNQTAASATSAACTVIRRDPVTGQLSGDTLTVGGLFGIVSNSGRLATDGIDVTVNYTYPLSFGKLNFAFNGNWTNSSVFQATPVSLARDCVGFYSVNCASIQPKFTWNLRTTMTVSDIDVSLLWRHIDGMRQEPADVDIANGDGPAFTGDPAGIPGTTQYNFGKIPAYNYIDLATRFDVSKNFDLTITVNNLFDKLPPIVGFDIGSTLYNSGNTYPSTYDPLGRSFSVAAHVKF